MEDLLRTLIAIPSTTDNQAHTKTAIDFMADYVAQRGMFVERFEKNGFHSIVATTKAHDREPEVMLMAHLDVVPGEVEMFTLRSEDGKYIGRGALDMKFAAAVFLQVIDDIQDKLADYSLGLMLTTDEEVGGRNGVAYLVEAHNYRPKVCIVPDGGVDWTMIEFAKGVQWIELKASGTAAHASRPWEGDHAVHKLLKALGEIRLLYPYEVTSDHQGPLLSVGVIKGGETANRIADTASATLDVRYNSREDRRLIAAKVHEIAAMNDVQAHVVVDDPPTINDMASPYLQTFSQIIQEVVGKRPKVGFDHGSTDARFFSGKGVPCIIVQPPGGGWHGAGEWVSASGCAQYRTILQRYITEVARVVHISTNGNARKVVMK